MPLNFATASEGAIGDPGMQNWSSHLPKWPIPSLHNNPKNVQTMTDRYEGWPVPTANKIQYSNFLGNQHIAVANHRQPPFKWVICYIAGHKLTILFTIYF